MTPFYEEKKRVDFDVDKHPFEPYNKALFSRLENSCAIRVGSQDKRVVKLEVEDDLSVWLEDAQLGYYRKQRRFRCFGHQFAMRVFGPSCCVQGQDSRLD